ncbi:stalk domain-containing protein [Alkalihalophilus marmarensis]|uniref:Copper amine oxidase-like N-terminal domain-containing protein n=1 Tax=Alkalihalophilus marmarensis DSM 21297 TaxID=1188261 RepID=U6SRV8_9BACI|nr:stalk domain-containing protein [Alkalihalophilus marmarensis]ERN54328.1 hypothetical protein A33I_07880 [Alkalihalophilus marmarensis DSM 21297]
MKKIFLIFIILTFVITAFNPVSANAQKITIYINDQIQIYDQDPIIQQGRTLVPLRGIFESLGANVQWNQTQQRITATKDNRNIELTLGSNQTKINGNIHYIDVPAQAINGRTLVPLRFVGEALGATVNWDRSSNSVKIYSSKSNVIKPATPTGVYAGIFDGTISVSWDYDNNVDYYHVYFSNSYGGTYYPFILNGIKAKLDYGIQHTSVKAGETWYYKVTAVKNGVESGFSQIVSATMPYPVNNKSLSLVADNSQRTYLGKATTNTYDSESIFNEYGSYGSKYGSYSIWNSYGSYGSPYATYSAFNDYTSTPPILIDAEGTVYGRVTTNSYLPGAIHPNNLYEVLQRNGY